MRSSHREQWSLHMPLLRQTTYRLTATPSLPPSLTPRGMPRRHNYPSSYIKVKKLSIRIASFSANGGRSIYFMSRYVPSLLRTHRRSWGLSQRELADLLGFESPA